MCRSLWIRMLCGQSKPFCKNKWFWQSYPCFSPCQISSINNQFSNLFEQTPSWNGERKRDSRKRAKRIFLFIHLKAMISCSKPFITLNGLFQKIVIRDKWQERKRHKCLKCLKWLKNEELEIHCHRISPPYQCFIHCIEMKVSPISETIYRLLHWNRNPVGLRSQDTVDNQCERSENGYRWPTQ